jgi:hypothetical protein
MTYWRKLLVYPAMLASLDTILQAHACNALLHTSYASRSSRSRLTPGPIPRDIQDRESELPRIYIPRTSVNRPPPGAQGLHTWHHGRV